MEKIILKNTMQFEISNNSPELAHSALFPVFNIKTLNQETNRTI
jgi:hypothetical protein